MTWPRCARAYVVKPPAPGRRPGFPHWGPAPLSSRARAQRSEGSSQRSTALGIRLSGGLSRTTKSSLLASLSVFHRMAMSLILRTGLRVGPNRTQLPEQAWRDNRQAAGAIPRSRAARAAGPTILIGLKGRPRLSSHNFQSHGNVQAHRRG
jgi:hypothetical protein